jgi:hypothetical protein
MTQAAQSLDRPESHSSGRRRLFGLLAAASLAFPALLLTGCESATPPRDYQRPKSYIRGHGGNKGKNRGRGGN